MFYIQDVIVSLINVKRRERESMLLCKSRRIKNTISFFPPRKHNRRKLTKIASGRIFSLRLQCKSLYFYAQGFHGREPRKVSIFVVDRNATGPEGTFQSLGRVSGMGECFVRSIETLAPFVPICRK